MAAAIVEAITNNSWVNLQLFETGADGKIAVTDIARQYVGASGKPLSLAEFRAAPRSGHWIGDGTGSTRLDPRYEIAPFRFEAREPVTTLGWAAVPY